LVVVEQAVQMLAQQMVAIVSFLQSLLLVGEGAVMVLLALELLQVLMVVLVAVGLVIIVLYLPMQVVLEILHPHHHRKETMEALDSIVQD
jgi:hypothetical protein